MKIETDIEANVLTGWELAVIPKPPADKDRALFDKCETEIEKGLKTKNSVDTALDIIHERELYKLDGFKSFKSYCEQRWKISRGHAYRLIANAELNQKVSPAGDTFPISEHLGRRINKLPEDEKEKILNKIKEGKIKSTKEIAREITSAEDKVKDDPSIRMKSDYVKLIKIGGNLEAILATDQTEVERVLQFISFLENNLKVHKERYRAKLLKLQQDAEFDVAA